MSWTTAAFDVTTFFLLIRSDSKFGMPEANYWRSTDAYKNSKRSGIEREWLGKVPLSPKIFSDP